MGRRRFAHSLYALTARSGCPGRAPSEDREIRPRGRAAGPAGRPAAAPSGEPHRRLGGRGRTSALRYDAGRSVGRRNVRLRGGGSHERQHEAQSDRPEGQAVGPLDSPCGSRRTTAGLRRSEVSRCPGAGARLTGDDDRPRSAGRCDAGCVRLEDPSARRTLGADPGPRMGTTRCRGLAWGVGTPGAVGARESAVTVAHHSQSAGVCEFVVVAEAAGAGFGHVALSSSLAGGTSVGAWTRGTAARGKDLVPRQPWLSALRLAPTRGARTVLGRGRTVSAATDGNAGMRQATAPITRYLRE